MAESLFLDDILCNKWTWDPNKWFTVKFNKNGTGELYCRVEFSLFIAAEFDWKSSSHPDAHIEAKFPAIIDIEMTLTKRNMKDPNLTKEEVLEETAFRLKTYRLQLDKSRFLVKGRTTYGYNPEYEYRLTWDVSPYPSLNEWKDKVLAEACKFWERKDFYRGVIEEENAG